MTAEAMPAWTMVRVYSAGPDREVTESDLGAGTPIAAVSVFIGDDGANVDRGHDLGGSALERA